jgi:hypothetical protein
MMRILGPDASDDRRWDGGGPARWRWRQWRRAMFFAVMMVLGFLKPSYD